MSALNIYNIHNNENQLEVHNLYRIPKLHLYKQRYIVGSTKCSTKPHSLLLTKTLTAVK